MVSQTIVVVDSQNIVVVDSQNIVVLIVKLDFVDSPNIGCVDSHTVVVFMVFWIAKPWLYKWSEYICNVHFQLYLSGLPY